MNEKVPPTASNRRKKEFVREGDLVTYKRKRKTINPSTVVPPNTIGSANEGVSEPLPLTESTQATLGAQVEFAQAVNIPQGSKFETESAQATLGAQPPLPNVFYNFDVNISIVGGYSEGERATSNDDVGPSDKSLLRSFRFHRARSIALRRSLKAGGVGNSLSLRKLKEHYAYKLEKVPSDGIAVAAKKKKGLTTRSVARAYMLYVPGSFLFPTKKGTDVSARYLYLFAKDKVAKKWSWGSTVLAHMYYNLGAASRDEGRQFACCTTLLESWRFAHFPKLVGIPKEMDSDTYELYGTHTEIKGIPHMHSRRSPFSMWKEFVLKKADRGQRVREGPLVCTEAYLEWFTSILWTTICPITVDLVVDDDVGIHQRKEASVNEHGDIPVHQSEDIAEQYDASHHEHASLSPNARGTIQTRGRSGGFNQQITVLNGQLQKLKEDKEKESEANINLKEALKEKTSECDLLKEAIEQMNEEIELKRVVDEQCILEFKDLPRQLDTKILEYTNLEEKNTSFEAELRQKFGLEDCNQNLSIELNKKCKESESLKAVNALLMEQINLQLPPAKSLVMLQSHQSVPDTTLTKKYEDLLAAHEDVKNKLIAKEDFRQRLVNAEEMMKSLEANNSEWICLILNSCIYLRLLCEVWRQALKKTLTSEGMGDMGDPTFENLFEQNERFFTITQQ
ncbi:hypothetical protein GIB67_013177 [Kingdonia uniflora]|uniref:Aminotransferase-like plant mobile domain-containing protein n=1 Tax=Kingdonia uniflora TaxID=39325 RepID=A0A7J7LCU5_9MAGN|nr:hypothetical protein GIB67_013177 [Kingdonia uniflora]